MVSPLKLQPAASGLFFFFYIFCCIFFPLPFIKQFQVVPAWGPLQWGVPGQADLQEPRNHLPDVLEEGILDSIDETPHVTPSRTSPGLIAQHCSGWTLSVHPSLEGWCLALKDESF